MRYLTEFPIRSRYSLSKEPSSSTSMDRTTGCIGSSGVSTGDIFADGFPALDESWVYNICFGITLTAAVLPRFLFSEENRE